jgi:nucleotide-binding universal stress UspA family protein
MRTYRNVLCPVDLSEPSRGAMRAAAQLMGDHGKLTLFHVVQLPAIAAFETLVPMADLRGDIDARVVRELEDWRREAQATGAAEVGTAFTNGVPWHAIVERAADMKAELIVMGTHGYTGLRHALLGSVAEKVVRHAPCDVLVVRSH